MLASLTFATHLILSSGPAEAPALGIGPTRGEGAGATKQLLDQLDAAVVTALREDGYAIEGIGLACADNLCVFDSALANERPGALVLEVRESMNDYEVTATLWSAADATSLAQEQLQCEICSFEEVTDVAVKAARVVAQAAAQLSQEAAPAPVPSFEGVLRVESSPAGGEVFVDGVSMGRTPFEGSVGVGTREVEVYLDGYTTGVGTVEVTSQEARAVSLTLTPATDAGSLWNRPWVRPTSFGAMGAGGAAMLTGFILLGIDENPYKRDCEGDNVDADGVCRYRYNTLGAGVGLTVTGVVVAAAGVTMFVLNRRETQRPMSMYIGPQGVGLTGRF